ncbi:MAG: hypothetical protein LH617_01965 [Ramlibacter sp.]|nr:hypothetical protein [Ramlibacter sp.]
MNHKTILSIVTAALLAFQLAAPVGVNAQSPMSALNRGADTPEAARAKAEHVDKTQKLFDHGAAGRPKFSVLEEVRAMQGLPATKANVAAVLGRLRTTPVMNHSESVQLVRLAGDLHAQSTDEKDKAEIRGLLAALATSSANPLLGQAAALTYSRLGYFPDTLGVLATARQKGFITNDHYFGDLAHLLPDVKSGNDQLRVVHLLTDGKNAHARMILNNLMMADHVFEGLTPAAAQGVLTLMTSNPPGFNSIPTAIGGVDMLNYNDWLVANVRVSSHLSKEPQRSTVARLVKVDTTDPRALVSMMHWDETANLVKDAMSPTELAKIDSRIAAWAATSDSPWIKQVSDRARANLAAVKK